MILDVILKLLKSTDPITVLSFDVGVTDWGAALLRWDPTAKKLRILFGANVNLTAEPIPTLEQLEAHYQWHTINNVEDAVWIEKYRALRIKFIEDHKLIKTPKSSKKALTPAQEARIKAHVDKVNLWNKITVAHERSSRPIAQLTDVLTSKGLLSIQHAWATTALMALFPSDERVADLQPKSKPKARRHGDIEHIDLDESDDEVLRSDLNESDNEEEKEEEEEDVLAPILATKPVLSIAKQKANFAKERRSPHLRWKRLEEERKLKKEIQMDLSNSEEAQLQGASNLEKMYDRLRANLDVYSRMWFGTFDIDAVVIEYQHTQTVQYLAQIQFATAMFFLQWTSTYCVAPRRRPVVYHQPPIYKLRCYPLTITDKVLLKSQGMLEPHQWSFLTGDQSLAVMRPPPPKPPKIIVDPLLVMDQLPLAAGLKPAKKKRGPPKPKEWSGKLKKSLLPFWHPADEKISEEYDEAKRVQNKIVAVHRVRGIHANPNVLGEAWKILFELSLTEVKQRDWADATTQAIAFIGNHHPALRRVSTAPLVNTSSSNATK